MRCAGGEIALLVVMLGACATARIEASPASRKPAALVEPARVPRAPALPAYRQPFGNPQRNSAVGAVLAEPRPLKPLIELTRLQGFGHVEWLYGFRDGRHITAVFWPAHARVVQLEPPAELGVYGSVQHAWPVHAEDSDQLVVSLGSSLRRPGTKGDDDDIPLGTAAEAENVRALIARADGYVLLSQRERTHQTRSEMVIAERGDWANQSYPPWTWRHPIPFVHAHASPALADDSLVVCVDDRLIYLAANGTGVVDKHGMIDTTVIAEVNAQLAPDLTSVDLQDRVWGFQRTDYALVGFSARGEALGAPLALGVVPAQPSVALPDGALAIVAQGSVLKVKDGAIVWRARLPEGEPRATADAQGTLVVRAGRELVVLDASGHTRWQTTLPAPITSNPLITTTGRLCVATEMVLWCN